MKVTIPDPPGSLVAINVNKLGHLSKLRDGDWKKCDYLLVAVSGGEVLACFVELKKTMRDETEAHEQLRRSLPIWKYLQSACEVECEYVEWSPVPTVRYSLVAERGSVRLDKQRVRNRSDVESYKGIQVRKFIGNRIPFSKLV